MTESEFVDAIVSSRMGHYVYGLCLDNGAVFYVGKGAGFRALEHAKSATQEDSSEKARYIKSIGDRLRYTIFMHCADDVFAKGYEAYLIRGHHEVLTNIIIPSVSIIDKMFDPVDPLKKALADLAFIDEKIKTGDRECRLGLLSIIFSCPSFLPKIPDSDLAWAAGIADGAKARIAIKEQLEAMTDGRH